MSNSIDSMSGANNAATTRRLQQNQQSKVNGVANSQKQARSQGDDVVSLTGTAENLRSMASQLASEPQVNQEKIAAVKDALASGNYQLDPARIAQKFVEIEKALGKL